MRQDTAFGPVWLFPDALPEQVAIHSVRLELLWPSLDGFTAMHTGPSTGGGWIVRAPLAALEEAGLATDSAAEHPVAEGTVWPPIHIPVPNRLEYFAPSITPEQLYKQNERRRDWEEGEREIRTRLERAYKDGRLERPEWMGGEEMPDETILGDRERR